MHSKAYSQSCEENKDPILGILEIEFSKAKSVLEIGSGTGQHAVYFAGALRHLQWQCSDIAPQMPGIKAWLAEAKLANTPPPLCLDVRDSWRESFGDGCFDAVFSANTTHIMSWPSVLCLFERLGEVLCEKACIALYGPFNYKCLYTSDSNARFDQWLKSRDPLSGIRDFESLQALAEARAFNLHKDYAMPANNRLLVWRRGCND